MTTPLSVSRVEDAAVWDAALMRLPDPQILQSWAWGETKAQTGWAARRLLWQRDGLPVAAASMLVRRVAGGVPLAVAYIPRGPVLDWSDAALAQTILAQLEDEARKARALFVKMDPAVRADAEEGRSLTDLLNRRGWVVSPDQIQYRNTVISDLTPDEDTLLAAMKPKWRYNIRLAERKGVIVRSGSAVDLPAFYAMYLETGERDGFLVRPYEYYQTVWERFLRDGLAHVLLAEVDERPIAGIVLFKYGPTAWYFYGASTDQARDFMPNHALQWTAMQWAKEVGCTRYDWWGAPDDLVESDPTWGVYRFKMGFGGEFVPGIGAWDYPTFGPAYTAYTRAMPRLLDILRRRHRVSAPGDGA